MLEDSTEELHSNILHIKGPKEGNQEDSENNNYLLFEVIKRDQEFSSVITFKRKLMELINSNFDSLKSEKVNKYFEKPSAFKSFEDIINAITIYNKELWNYELKEYQKYPEASKKASLLIDFYKEYSDKDHLMKLGWGSSSIATSLYLLACKDNEELNIRVGTKSVKIRFKELMKMILWKGKMPNLRSTDIFPLLKKNFVSNDGTAYPIGWTEVIFEEIESKC